MSKVYQKDKVSYGARGRKWTFNHENGYSYTTPTMPGGVETAHKIAGHINGGCKRTGRADLDGLARSHMSKAFHEAAKAQSQLVSR